MSPERPIELAFPEFEEMEFEEMVPTQPPRLVRQNAVYIEVESESENEESNN